VRIIFALLLIGCTSRTTSFHCETDAQCTLPARPGLCVDREPGVCALVDVTCPSGYRYDDTAGHDGACYVFPDGGLPPDLLTSPSDMSEDMTTLGDMSLPPGTDLAGIDMAQAPFAWYAETSGTSQPLRSVWVADSTHVYAIADGVGVLFSAGNGTWATQTTGLPSSPTLNDIWGSGPTDIYATGASGSAAGLYHSTGNGSWSLVTNTNSGGQYGIGGVSANAVFVGGGAGQASRWNGTVWSSELCGSSSILNSVWAGGTVAYAAGNAGNVCYTTSNGTWTAQSSNTGAQVLTGIWGTSVTDLHVVGYKIDFSAGTTTYYAAHSTGTGTWANVSIPATAKPSVFSHSIWGTSASDVYIVGQAGHLFHNDGTAWTESVVVDNLGVHATQNLNSISGNGPRNIYIVGGGGYILHGK